MKVLSECTCCDECNKPFEENDEIIISSNFKIEEIIPRKSPKMIHSDRVIMDGDLYRASCYCSIKCLIYDMKDNLN